jgi:hypothetical protein
MEAEMFSSLGSAGYSYLIGQGTAGDAASDEEAEIAEEVVAIGEQDTAAATISAAVADNPEFDAVDLSDEAAALDLNDLAATESVGVEAADEAGMDASVDTAVADEEMAGV